MSTLSASYTRLRARHRRSSRVHARARRPQAQRAQGCKCPWRRVPRGGCPEEGARRRVPGGGCAEEGARRRVPGGGCPEEGARRRVRACAKQGSQQCANRACGGARTVGYFSRRRPGQEATCPLPPCSQTPSPARPPPHCTSSAPFAPPFRTPSSRSGAGPCRPACRHAHAARASSWRRNLCAARAVSVEQKGHASPLYPSPPRVIRSLGLMAWHGLQPARAFAELRTSSRECRGEFRGDGGST